ncbi:DUF6383 domain-containing protein [uncultured Parabacteroides sp.]|uniref:DUF6383 domain-containing protein n=1 Tax=uncultured Parabacteroides sp. TaxID=512312 RepID=UPI00258B2691|nr:DUF6383 domain-containing protein [uncultured Parabacteroides sp.]
MNKKFSTLLVGALLTTSLGAFAQGTTRVHTDENKIGHGITLRPTATASAAIGAGINHFDADKLYQLTDADGKVLIQTRNYQTGELNLKLVNVAEAPINASLWSIKVTSDNVSGVSYTMTNKETNLELVYAHVNAIKFDAPTVTSGDNDNAASILEGCLTNWTWYSTISQNTDFEYKPIYSYFANRDSVVVLQKNLGDEIIAAKYSHVEAETNVQAITDAIELKPVLAGGIVLKAADLNKMVDFQYNGTFNIESAVNPTTTSPFLTNTFSATDYNATDYPAVAAVMAGTAAERQKLGLYGNASNGLHPSQFVYFTTADDKVLSVDTVFFSNNSKELPMTLLAGLPKDEAITVPGMSPAAWEARSLFKVTYYPSQDSLVFEPMNALKKNATKGAWQNADYAFNSTNNDDKLLHVDAAISGRKHNADNGEVVVRLAYLTDTECVITAKNTEVDNGIGLPGSLQTKFTFKDRKFDYLSRAKVGQGLYFIKDVATEKYVVDNFVGKLMLDAETAVQDYNDMPATMWVVKTTGCGDVPTVAIYNREYADEVYEGQLYSNEDGSVYFINQDFNKFEDKQLQHLDAYTFTAVDNNEAKTSARHGYKYLNSADLLYTKYYLNYNLFANPNLYLNVTDSKSFAPTEGRSTTYELTEAKDVFDTNGTAIDVPFGFGKEIGLPQLIRTGYVLKVSDKNLIDNDKIYVYLVSPKGKTPYYKAMTKTEAAASAADAPKLAVFYLKADQRMHSDLDVRAYVLVDLNNGTALDVDNGWMQANCEDAPGEMTYLRLDNMAPERATAFSIITDNRPLYMDLGEEGRYINIFRARGTGSEYLFEDSNNQSNAPQVVKDFGYLGMTAEKIQPAGKESKTAIYADYVVRSDERMPQYLLVLRPDTVEDGKWCNTHGYNPNCEHEVDYNGYLAGSFLINLTDSVKGSTNMLNNPDVYKWQSYTRLGFVEGVHQVDADGEYLYILKEGRKLADLKNKDGVLDPRDLYNEAIFEKKPVDGLHKNYAFSLRFTDDDHKDFLLESNLDEVSHIASFKGAWVKIHNGVPVLAEYTVDNGNHEDDDKKMQELINQAQIFNLEDTSDYATSNEGVSTSGVSVIAGEGTITILNATGKTVTVSNILGQTVTVQNITSDNATITAPAGIVVVAVDGESAVKAIVK